MTEIPDLSAMFGQPPRLSRAQIEHAERLHKAQHDAEMLAYAQVQFFAPILCNCTKRGDWTEPSPPQLHCVVHGHLQMNHDGRILMFGIPKEW